VRPHFHVLTSVASGLVVALLVSFVSAGQAAAIDDSLLTVERDAAVVVTAFAAPSFTTRSKDMMTVRTAAQRVKAPQRIVTCVGAGGMTWQQDTRIFHGNLACHRVSTGQAFSTDNFDWYLWREPSGNQRVRNISLNDPRQTTEAAPVRTRLAKFARGATGNARSLAILTVYDSWELAGTSADLFALTSDTAAKSTRSPIVFYRESQDAPRFFETTWNRVHQGNKTYQCTRDRSAVVFGIGSDPIDLYARSLVTGALQEYVPARITNEAWWSGTMLQPCFWPA
jgi:hypothetical protein